VLKDTHLAEGRGVRIFKEVPDEVVDKYYNRATEKCIPSNQKRQGGQVIQRYIMSPLLLNKRKMEMRAYWAVVR
jgi:hypothetical protein